MLVPCLVIRAACMIGVFAPGEGSGDGDDWDARGGEIGPLDRCVAIVGEVLEAGEVEGIVGNSLTDDELAGEVAEITENRTTAGTPSATGKPKWWKWTATRKCDSTG